MPTLKDEFKDAGRRSTESFRRSSEKRHEWNRIEINNDKDERDQVPFGSYDQEAYKYLSDRQTSTTDLHLYSQALREYKKDMSNPYLDKGVNMPYEISQNRYKQHVLGSKYENYNQQRPEAMDGYHNLGKPYSNPAIPESNRTFHNWPIGAHPLEVAHERRQNNQPQYESPRHNYQQREPERMPPPQYYGESPRRDYESRTYRSGRPDLGVNSESSVPYPQEPVRRSRHEYQQPPEIGFDAFKDSAEQKPKFEGPDDDNNGHPGWILLLRFNKEGEHLVRKGLTFANQIAKDGGRVLGIARSYGIRIVEGGDGWLTFGRMIYHRGGQREIQQTPSKMECVYCVLAIYYPSLRKAQEWIDRDDWFKQKDFPAPYSLDCIALPLTTTIDPRQCKTIALSEYPKITHADYFRDNFSMPTERLMRSKFRATPYVVKGEYLKAKGAQDQVSAPTTITMDMEPVGFY